MTVSVFALVALVLLFVLISALLPLAERLRLPFTVLIAAVGTVIGAAAWASGTTLSTLLLDDYARWQVAELALEPSAVLALFLPPLLFEVALAVNVRRLMEDLPAILMLAIVAVIVATLGVGIALWLAGGLPILPALVLGAIISTTDPAAVVRIFRDLGAPRRLVVLIEGESLFNDAAAIALFSLLVAAMSGQSEFRPDEAARAFLEDFLGGVGVGFLVALPAGWCLPALRGLRLAEITLTVAIAYGSFLLAEQIGASGVVAVVVAGLVTGSHGRIRMNAANWDGIDLVWAQLGFWANALIFLIASMLIPPLLASLAWPHLGMLALVVIAAFAARAVVLFGLLPLLTALNLAAAVEPGAKMVILWGGVRGAVTLVLALSLVQGIDLDSDPERATVALLAAAFVLFTLFANATTLPLAVRLAGLDRMDPVDAMLHDRILVRTMRDLKEEVDRLAADHQIAAAVVANLDRDYEARIAALDRPVPADPTTRGERQRIGLTILGRYEHWLYLRVFRDGLMARETLRVLRAKAGRLADIAQTEGVEGYRAAMGASITYDIPFRLALWAWHRLHWSRPLAWRLAGRFEALIVMAMILSRIARTSGSRLPPLIGADAADDLFALMEQRRLAVTAALEALTLQYPDYAHAVQARFLGRAALRLERERYRQMEEAQIIGHELKEALAEDVRRRWQGLATLTPPDLAVDRLELLRHLPLFAGLGEETQQRLARLMRPRLALPGERILEPDTVGDTLFLIASGAVEQALAGMPPRRLGSGDFFGLVSLLQPGRPRRSAVLALGYSQLMTLRREDVLRLAAQDPHLAGRLARLARVDPADIAAVMADI